MKSAESNPAREFLRRIDEGELAEGFIQELRKLTPQHRREACEALVRRPEQFQLSRSAERAVHREVLANRSVR